MNHIKAISWQRPGLILTGLTFIFCMFAISSPAKASEIGQSGWEWPLGSSPNVTSGGEFLGNGCGPNGASALGGYGYYFGGIFHLGIDMFATVNTDVHSISDGVIKRTSSDFGGDGGAVYVEHTASDGTKFMAVYGHLKNYVTSGVVDSNDVIGEVNTDHTHFGVRPGDYSSFPSSSLGTLSCSTYWTSGNAPTSTNGFVNPIPYLTSHPKSVSTFANGTFIRNTSNNNKVYVIAGGAPLYVNNWANVGGSKPTTAVTQAQFDALPDYPANGTYISAKFGTVTKSYVVAGRSAIYISNWANVGGSKPTTLVDSWAVENYLLQRPINGTYLKDNNGKNYVMAGGAAMYIENWANVGGVKQVTTFDAWALTNQFRSYPGDGTIISVKYPTNTKSYVIAGGAPMYIQNWANIGGQKPSVLIDVWAFNNKLRQRPADGTVITDGATNRTYVIAGGAPLYVSSWASIGGLKPYTVVDGWSLTNLLLSYPQDGTILKGYTSQNEYQVVGQQLVPIANPSQVTGARVIVDDLAIQALL